MKSLILILISLSIISCNKSETKMEVTSKNILLQSDSDPVVSINIWFKTGSVYDPKGKEGLAFITSQMMHEGATTKNKYDEILMKLDPIASGYGVKIDKEMMSFRGYTHKDNLSEFLPLFTDAIVSPAFNEVDFKRIIDNTIQSIEKNLRFSSDEELGKATLYGEIFAGTPYAHLTNGTVQSLKALTLNDVKEFYKTNINKNNYVIGLAGSFPNWLEDSLEVKLNTLNDGKENAKVTISNKAIEGINVTLVEKATIGTSTSIGFPISIKRGDEDFFALDIFRSWFGEHRNQSSYLYQVIREKRGINYGNYAYIDAFLNGGSYSMPNPNNARNNQIFEIWLRTVPHEDRHFALRAALRELQMVVDNGMTKENFEKTKQFLYKYALHYAPTSADRLGYQIDSKFYGIEDNNSYINLYREKIKNMTLEQVNAAIKKHLQYNNLVIAAVTQGAEQFKKDLVSNKISTKKYESPKPEEVLKEDKEIEKYPLNIQEAKVKIVKVNEMFEK